jgi:3-amino-4-hydroxybenzoic acid synthase
MTTPARVEGLDTKVAWIDARGAERPRAAIIEEGIHAGVNGVVSDDPDLLGTLPPTVARIAVGDNGTSLEQLAETADVLLLDHREVERAGGLAQFNGTQVAVMVTVDDQRSLDIACGWAECAPWTVIDFKDPTKIPLEIVLARASKAEGHVVTLVHDLEEAAIVLGVLEKGSDGVLLAPAGVGETTQLIHLCRARSQPMELEELEVTAIAHVGMGDRACVDTCSQLLEDEGILVGSYSSGMVLACSETHPLPYMPTRPFRVNAGALHSYTLAPGGRTRYLSELRSGAELLAVRASGETRRVVVGRVKIESRPLIEIRARSTRGVDVDLIVQDDWHVRVLGPGAKVLNVTHLRPGDRLLGATLGEQRHVGYGLSEFCLEQ